MRILLASRTGEAPEEVSVDPVDNLRESIDSMIEGFFEAVPGIGLALVVLLLFVMVARLLRGPMERRLVRARSKSFGKVFASLIHAGIIIAGLFFAIPLAVPSVDLLTMLGGLGLLGVAAGFAFQDILSNMLAGILLLIRDPFRAGDQIEVDDISGTVQLITIRETQILTYGGVLVYVPNADVYSNAIHVQTAYPQVRSSLIVGVDYDADLAVARQAALDALDRVEGVVDMPAPEAYYIAFGASSIDLDLRYWTSSRQADIRRVQDAVVEAVKAAFDEAGIGIPFSIVTLDAGESFESALVHAVSRGRSNGQADRGASPNGRAGRSRDDLEDLTRAELYALAQQEGVEGRSQMSKDELVSALRGR